MKCPKCNSNKLSRVSNIAIECNECNWKDSNLPDTVVKLTTKLQVIREVCDKNNFDYTTRIKTIRKILEKGVDK